MLVTSLFLSLDIPTKVAKHHMDEFQILVVACVLKIKFCKNDKNLLKRKLLFNFLHDGLHQSRHFENAKKRYHMRSFCHNDKDRSMSKGNSNIQELKVAFRKKHILNVTILWLCHDVFIGNFLCLLNLYPRYSLVQ